MLRENASRISIGLIAVAILLSAAACLGGGESPDVAAPSPLAFRPPTTTPSPTPAAVRLISTPGPCPSESGWIRVKGIIICLPTGATLRTLITECPPVGVDLPCGERSFNIIERGSSEVRISIESGEIVKWDVAPEDEEEFSRLILEPLEKAGQ